VTRNATMSDRRKLQGIGKQITGDFINFITVNPG
jgi:hypothetical protein